MTTGDAQDDLTSNPDTVTHTSNGPDAFTHTSNIILDGKLLRCRTIEEVPVHIHALNPIVLAPQTLMMPTVHKISVDATWVNVWTNRTPRQVSRTVIDGTTPGNIVHACGVGETSSLDIIGIIEATVPPCGLNVSHEIADIRQSASPDLIKSNKLDTYINKQEIPIIWFRHPFSLRYLVTIFPTLPYGISTRAVG